MLELLLAAVGTVLLVGVVGYLCERFSPLVVLGGIILAAIVFA